MVEVGAEMYPFGVPEAHDVRYAFTHPLRVHIMADRKEHKLSRSPSSIAYPG